MLSISHRPGDWIQLRAQTEYGVAFSGITWTSTRNTSWRTIAEKVSDLLVLLKYASNIAVTYIVLQSAALPVQ